MISLKSKADCCGCKACEQACPVNCVIMQIDDEGFWYPRVDEAKCISCNKCEKVCPINNSEKMDDDIKGVYAARSLDDKLVEKSSSGAIFTELAILVIEQGGVVFGAAFDRNYNVVHICVENEQDISLLKGSKYVQSDIRDCYSQAEVFLKQGRNVLFSGTPCQISGLKKYLHKDYSNLLAVDILCHGVPSPLVWQKYISEMRKNGESEISAISFRVKTQSGFYFKIGYNDGTSFIEPVNNNLFMRFFIRNFSLRPSCHMCRFKKMNRDSDITIGDCWKAGESIPELNGVGSISLVVVHSDIGDNYLKMIKNNLLIYKGELDLLLPSNEDSRNSVRANNKRKVFFKKLKEVEAFSCLADLEKPSVMRRIYWRIKKKNG